MQWHCSCAFTHRVELGFWRQTSALAILAANPSRHNRAVADGVVLFAVIGPVCALRDVRDIRVRLRQPAVHHGHPDTLALESASV